MKRIFTLIILALGLCFPGLTLAQQSTQRFVRIRDVSNNDWQASVRAFDLTFPATRYGLYTLSAGYFYDGGNLRRWLGAQMNSDNVAATTYAPWSGTFLHAYDTGASAWQRLTMTAAGDALAAATEGINSLSYNLFYDGTNYRRWLGAQINSDAISADTYVPYIGNFGHFYDITNGNWRRFSGDELSSDTVPTTTIAPYVGGFNHAYDTVGDVWQRVSMHAAGDALGATAEGLDSLSYNLFYDGTNYRRWLGAQANSDAVATTTVAPYNLSLNLAYDIDNSQWHRLNFINTHADDQAYTVGGLLTGSVLYADDGAQLDMLKLGATGGLQTEVDNWPSAFSEGDANVTTHKGSIATYHPAKTAGTAVDDAGGGTTGDIVLASTEVIGYPNWTLYIKNVGGGSGDALASVYVMVSPDGTNWYTITVLDADETAAQTLTSGQTGIAYTARTLAHRYVKLEALCGAGDDTTVDAWIVAHTN